MHGAADAAEFFEGSKVEELVDALADPELAGLLLADIAAILGVWSVGEFVECGDLPEYVAVVCGEVVLGGGLSAGAFTGSIGGGWGDVVGDLR